MSGENNNAAANNAAANETKQKNEQVSLKDVVDSLAKASKENKSKNKENVKVSLTERFDIEFIADFGEFKKGDTASVSEIAKEYYVINKVAKEPK